MQVGDIEQMTVLNCLKHDRITLKLMVFYRGLWCFLQADNEFQEHEKNFQLQNSEGHEIYIRNQTQPFAFEHHF